MSAIAASTSARLGPVAADGHRIARTQRVGQLERVAARDVEPVQQAVADQVEVRRHGRAGLAVERAQRVQHLARIVVGREQRPRLWIGLDARRSAAASWAERAGRDRRRAAHQAEQLSRRHVRSSRPTCARKSPVGITAEAV